MYQIKIHKDGYQVGDFTFGDIVEAITACRAANRMVRETK